MEAGLILVRLDSTRLPSKATLDIGGKKLVQWTIDGVQKLKGVEPILVTTERPVDDPLVEIAIENKIRYYRGDFENVAKRVADCLRHFKIKTFARLNGDSPLLNVQLLAEGFEILREDKQIDFVTNLIPRRFPYGMSLEVMRSALFLSNYTQFSTKRYQEHITSYFYDHSDIFNFCKISDFEENYHHLRFVVDTPEDLASLDRFLQQTEEDIHLLSPKNLIQEFLKQSND